MTVELIFKFLLSFVLGGLIGLQRERGNHPAGLKTNTLVCIGATLITLVSIEHFTEPHILAAIISGIGFLGAGTILNNQNKIQGLTTAASVWIVAGIGLAVGVGYYLGALITTGLALLVLEYGKHLEQKVKSNRHN